MTTPAPYVDSARPADAEALAALHLSALPAAESLSSAFGPAFVRSAYRGFLVDPTFIVLVARQGERVVGFTSLSARPYTMGMLRRGWREAFVGILRRPSVLVHPELRARARQLFRSGTALPTDAAQVAFTVVAPEARGLRIGSLLKQASIDACRKRGYAAIYTGIHHENTASQRLNEAAGFVEVPELRTGTFRYYRLALQPHAAGSVPDEASLD